MNAYMQLLDLILLRIDGFGRAAQLFGLVALALALPYPPTSHGANTGATGETARAV